MKIPIETKEEKEAWRKLLKQNAKIMAACIREFPSKPECVWIALFKSMVPSASQREATKNGLEMIKAAIKSLGDNKPEPVGFHGIMPPDTFEGGGPAIIDESPEPPPEIPVPRSPVAEYAFITVGTTATLLYENQSGKSKHISVSNNSIIRDMWIGTQDVNHHFGNMIPKTERRDVAVPAGRFLWGITDAGTARALISLSDGSAVFLKDIFESTPDDMPVCRLCGSSDLTQAVYQMVGSERKKEYVCLKCVRNLITDYQESLKELVPDSDSIPAEKPVCCLCGSSDLLQTVYLHGKVTKRSDSYIIPSTGQMVSISDSFICMKCLRKLIEREQKCQTRV